MLTLVRIYCAFVGVVVIANATVMLVSPHGWFRLPDWFRLHGFWFEGKWAHASPVQVRLTGAFVLALVTLVLYSLLFTGRY
jgi:hypothetical protein